jgi:hypothetical protein
MVILILKLIVLPVALVEMWCRIIYALFMWDMDIFSEDMLIDRLLNGHKKK